MKKKLIIVLSLLFVLTGCSANYELTYKKGIFTEEITIYEDKDISNNEELPSITKVEEKSDKVKIKDNEYYKIEHYTENDKNILKATYKFDKLSLKDSLVFNECFKEKSIIDEEKSIYIKLSGEVVCEYLENVSITFKTDKQVINTNAEKQNKRKGIYSWDKIPDEGIIIEVSKKNIKKDANIIPPVLRIIIVLILLGIGIYVLKKYNDLEE